MTPAFKRLLFAAVFFIVSLTSTVADSFSGRVVSVHDGDTVTVLVDTVKVKVRLADIDAPELKQAYGQESRKLLLGLVNNRVLEVISRGKDRYGRTLGVLIVDGQSINQAMVQAGMAWNYVAFSKDSVLQVLEQQARINQSGLWAQKDPVAPWEFRKNKAK